MATEIVTAIATDVGKDMARTILGAVIRQIKGVVNLEKNLQVLHKDFAHMVSFLEHIQNRFQDQHRMLPKPAEMCLRKMGDALTEAKQLIHRVNQQRTRCFGCCILCNPNLSRECREWNTTFDHLFQQLQRDLQILAATEQIVSNAAPEATPLLLQPVPDAGFVGSDIKSAEMQLQSVSIAAPESKPLLLQPVPEAGFVGSDIKSAEMQLQSVSIAAPEAKPLLLQPVPEAGFVGSDIKSAEMQLQTWLTQPPHRVVGVWGMGGIGKTSLLKIIHNHFQKVSSIFEIVIWVTVSQNFKIENLQNSIAKALKLKFDESFDNDLRKMTLSASLEKKKFLLILDDAWEQIYFDEVGISLGNKGSKVLISTRSAEVIGAMGAQKCSLKMQTLSEDEAWELFKGKAFINGPAALDKNIEAIAREIAKECKGLPLAVNVVGAAMTLKKTESDWGRALTLMRNTDINFPKLHKTIEPQLYQQLRYSYNDLSDHNLQCCFLYCAAFPEDEVIDAERLVQIWIAEGLVTGEETTYLMDVGHGCLDLLANRCLIEYVVPGEYVDNEYGKKIKIHDVLRDMAIHIGKSDEHWLFATDQHLTNFPGEKEISKCNRISLGHNDIEDLPTVLKCPNLVSLLLPTNRKLRHVPQPFPSSVISLRVLDLSWTRITALPISVGELRLLEFLDLSNCRKLIELPENIGNLSALQFLNLDSCEKLKGLPSTIRGLQKLKHLNLDECDDDMEVNSDDIGQLISLNRLVIGNTAVKAGDVINLTKMRVLKACVTADGGDVVTIDTWTEMKDLTLNFSSDGVNLEKIEEVEKLELWWYRRVTLPHCEFQKLKVLKLSVCTELRELPLRSFPRLTVLNLDRLDKLESLSGPSNVWNAGSMSKLEKLTIDRCRLLKKFPLGMRLPNLKVLNIQSCDSIKVLNIGNGDFPMLEQLVLCRLKELESITGSSGVWNEEATSKLERVEIRFCPLLRRLPRAMEKLFRLNKLDWVDRDESVVLSQLFSE